MRLLLFGSTGRIGSAIISASSLFDVEIIKPNSTQLNITDPLIVEKIRNLMPELIVNAAAFTDVDGAENNANDAYNLNKTAPGLLAQASQVLDIPLIHFSTDYVFSGKQKTPYVESDLSHPISIYGKSKLAGEEAIRITCEKNIILRTSWIFCENGNNFAKTILKLAIEKPALNVVKNEISCPTSALSVAHAVLKIAKDIQSGANEWGLYHFCGSSEISRYDYALEIIETAKKYCSKSFATVNPIMSSQFPTKATRPPYSAMNTNKLTGVFNIFPNDWRSDLDKTIKVLLKNFLLSL
jgi:dTDP-4-dehydrorhamnose reductase